MVKQKDKTTDNSRIQDVQDAPDSVCQIKNAGLIIQDVQDDQNELDDQDKTNDNSLDVFRNKIDFLVQDFIEREYPDIPESELQNDRGFFPSLIDYLYNIYFKGLLKTDRTNKQYRNNKYNIKQLDQIFNIYKLLCYKYKFNKRPTITEYGLLVGISKKTIYNWSSGISMNTGLTPEYMESVKSWIECCENALIDGSGEYVKEIFLLKSCYGYKDSSNELTVKHEIIPTLTPDQIPSVLGIGSSGSHNLITG